MAVLERSLDELCINTIRTLAMDAVQKANSGHPGLPMGAAPMAYVLWQRFLKHDPAEPSWPDRDRFVLSAGHGSMLLYALLHLTGYDLTMDDIMAFRQWESRTPGHPERFMTPGVEATTGPLGQGAANAVGMAIAERSLAARFNGPGHVVVDHWTYALVSDGDLMEGVTAEASSLAGHLGLGKLVFLYDSNDVSLDGPTSMAFTEDVARRYEAYGWHVQRVEDGNTDLAGIERAIAAARSETQRPSLIVVRTTIGYGSPNKAGTADAHGSPLGPKEVALTKECLGWDPQASFYVPDDARRRFRTALERGARSRSEWQQRFDAWARANPELALEWRRCMAGELPEDFSRRAAEVLPRWEGGAQAATRDAGGKAQNALAALLPELIGGDADLAGSTKTTIEGSGDFDGQSGEGRNLHFGVREHAMGAIGNGILYHGGLRAFVATFFVFSDYMRPAVRLAALNSLPLICVWTHDSVALGEDGPTHQPVEHLASLRAMPNLLVLRPADANETAQAWRIALEETKRPVALVLTRQKLPVLSVAREELEEGVRRGAYVVADPEGSAPDVILIATGSEVALALEARKALAADGIGARVVSMPSWELFAEQDEAWREKVLPRSVRARVSVEAGAGFGWERWIGEGGRAVALERFGASAPGEVNMAKLGFTAERVVQAARAALGR
ncbi:MAG TPA: transketolase [Planctomycetota bacterium]|nr:transketolase [Planctomycetota bacterium]